MNLGKLGAAFGRLGAQAKQTAAGGAPSTAGEIIWIFPLITKAS